MFYSETLGLKGTDATRWRLETTSIGNEKWVYYEAGEEPPRPQNECEKFHLRQTHPGKPAKVQPTKASEALDNAAQFFSNIQDKKSGTWPNMYKGPMFMSIGYVAAAYFTHQEVPDAIKKEMIRYLCNTAHPVDGGWGLHETDKSTCFGTSVNYVLLRLLGVSADEPWMVKARKTLLRLGGAIGCPHWGKMWLSVLSLYKWEGVNPTPSELFCLPYALPIHPMRWWVHTRAIYAPAAYLATARVQCEVDDLLLAIRSEIFVKPFDEIDFAANRNNICSVDLYYPHTSILNVLNWCMSTYEKFRPGFVKNYCNKRAYKTMLMDLENTDDLSIAPVSAAFSAIVLYVEQGPDSPQFKRVFERMREVLFLSPIGMCVMGTNGSQVWDAAFAIQYFFMAGLAETEAYRDMITRTFNFLVRSQFDTNCVPGSFRDDRKGAWPFSTKDQGYTVCDCTAEAMKAILMVMNSDFYKDLHQLYDLQKLHGSIDILLQLQNLGRFEYGAFASYELIRGTPLLEHINPAEVFGNIMVEYPYVECSDSSVLGLIYYTRCQDYKSKEINASVKEAVKFIEKAQRVDGSWYGSWGICFTYAAMFALEAFSEVGKNYGNSEHAHKGCDFLVAKQNADGGWGETMKSCETHACVFTKDSFVVQTAWATIGLLLAEYPDEKVIRRGVEFLLRKQCESGEWLFDSTEGVFNHSCAIEYPNYKFLFPIKAIGLYIKRYGDFTL